MLGYMFVYNDCSSSVARTSVASASATALAVIQSVVSVFTIVFSGRGVICLFRRVHGDNRHDYGPTRSR